MVRKGFARLIVQDCLRERQASHSAASTAKPSAPCVEGESGSHYHNGSKSNGLKTGSESMSEGQPESAASRQYSGLSSSSKLLEDRGDSLADDKLDKELEQAAIAESAEQFDCMAAPGMLLGKECGNMYAASVYASLASLVYEKKSELEGKRILVSSFGSGLAASIFCIRAKHVDGKYSLESIADKVSKQTTILSLNAAYAYRKLDKFCLLLGPFCL